MRDSCENPFCENPGAKVVPVSVDEPADQERTLCVPCEEAYTWGVQHGTISARANPALSHLERFLRKDGFVILTHNEGDPSKAFRGLGLPRAAGPQRSHAGDVRHRRRLRRGPGSTERSATRKEQTE